MRERLTFAEHGDALIQPLRQTQYVTTAKIHELRQLEVDAAQQDIEAGPGTVRSSLQRGQSRTRLRG